MIRMILCQSRYDLSESNGVRQSRGKLGTKFLQKSSSLKNRWVGPFSRKQGRAELADEKELSGNQELQSTIRLQDYHIKYLTSERNLLQHSLDSIVEGRKHQSRQISQLTNIVDNTRKDRDHRISLLTSELKSTRNRRDYQRGRANRLLNDLKCTRKYHDQKINRLKTDLENTRKEREKKVRRVNDLESALKSLEDNIIDLTRNTSKDGQEETHRLDDLESALKRRDDEIIKLTNEKEGHKEDTNELEGKIADLKPPRKNVAWHEIKTNFRGLRGAIDDWVENRVGTIFDNAENSARLLEYIRENAKDAADRFRALLNRHEDLVRAAKYPTMSQHPTMSQRIISALIWRYLYEEIFSGPFYDKDRYGACLIDQVADSMAQQSDPEISETTLRSWTNEAYHGIILHPDFAVARAKSLRAMSYTLATSLHVLMPHMTLDEVCESIEENIMDGAMALQEKIKTSGNVYYIRLTKYGQDDTSTLKLVRDRRWTELEDVFKNTTELDFDAKLPPKDRADYHAKVLSVITPVCTLAPALMEARLGEKEHRLTVQLSNPYESEDLGDDVCLRPQKHMYAWAEAAEREERLRREPQGIVDAIREMRP